MAIDQIEGYDDINMSEFVKWSGKRNTIPMNNFKHENVRNRKRNIMVI